MAEEMHDDFDYVVVGGGTAGSVIAARLAESGRFSVCLLEAGPPDQGQDRVLQIRDWQALLGSELDYDYTIEPQQRGNGSIRHSRARVLGGCSSHNSCIAFRAPDFDMRAWEQHGAAGWGPAGTAPYFERVLERVPLERVEPNNPVNAAFMAAAVEAGLPEVAFDTGGGLDAGVGMFQLNTRGPMRLSSSVAYLHPLESLPTNLTLYTNVVTHRIVLDEHNVATGVETSRGPIRAAREVIVCCGAFDSPKLLLLSGIGPAWHLREHGIPVKVHHPGVGENLLDHPEGVVIYESKAPIPPQVRQYWEVGVFARSRAEVEEPDIMMHFGLQPFDMNTRPLGYPTAEHGFSITPNVARARSRGTVRLRSGRVEDAPVIDFRYFTDPAGYDEDVMLAGIELARRIAAMSPLNEWVARELAPGPEVQGDRALSEYMRRSANTVYHPAGTCRMGADADPLAVLDPALRVRGVPRLRVADASVFPAMITVNPCITCMMIGEKCADLVLQAHEGA